MKQGGEKREESPHLIDSESIEDDDNELNSARKRKEKSDDSTRKDGNKREGPPPLTDSEPSEDEEDELDPVRKKRDRSDRSVIKDGKEKEELPPLTDSEPSEDEDDKLDSQSQTDTETKCRSCSFHVELPIELEESNQVFINCESGEILIFPEDETRNEEEWIQSSVIEGTSQEVENDKIWYAKGDSQKLEKFLRQEREGAARIIKQRCLEHSKKCETCDILSTRMESQKESTLMFVLSQVY